MNDKLLFENYLLVLKSTVEVYVHGTLESSNSKVRNLMEKSLGKILLNQYETYNKMVDNNWYKISNVKKENIGKLLNKLKK